MSGSCDLQALFRGSFADSACEYPAQRRGRVRLTLSYLCRASDPEAGVARGIDFHHVSAVLNFDLPPTPEAYIHRAGR